jgi:uncharacterized protein (TIGR03382 family)
LTADSDYSKKATTRRNIWLGHGMISGVFCPTDMRKVSSLFFLLWSQQVLAHGGEYEEFGAASFWSWASWGLLFLLRPRRKKPFGMALIALFVALVWPLETLAERSFAAHMIQHMVIIAVAAPLLVASRPSIPLLKGAKSAGRLLKCLSVPYLAFVLHGIAVWAGHMPAVLEAAIAYPLVHFLEHAVLFGTAVLLWWSLRHQGRVASGAACLWTLGTMIHTSMLGALLTFAPRLLYPTYTLEDQQLAGLIMWVPGGFLYVAAALSFAAAWLGKRERQS